MRRFVMVLLALQPALAPALPFCGAQQSSPGRTRALIESTWEQGGWVLKLDAAVRQASNKLVGPLVSPHEPGHSTYTPVAVASP